MDRCFRSAFDALETIKSFRQRRIALWLLDLGDVSGNGVNELIMTVLAAVAQFERGLISERISDQAGGGFNFQGFVSLRPPAAAPNRSWYLTDLWYVGVS